MPQVRITRTPLWRTICLLTFGLAALASLATAQNRESTGSAANIPPAAPAAGYLPSSQQPGAANKPNERLREGTRLIDVVGTFQSLGNDNVSFSPAGSKDSYRVLENLMLQRISQVLDENRAPRQWVASGLITEYRGSNYLLVTKAVIKVEEGDSAAGR
jgi:hypothetical protein